MNSSQIDYISASSREHGQDPISDGIVALNPWTAQNIVYELIVNHYLTNDPVLSGFNFSQKYNTDFTKSDIQISIANDWKNEEGQKRPAVFISRDAAKINSPVMNQTIGRTIAESEAKKWSMMNLDITVSCIATNVGFAEQLAEFTRIPFRYFEEQIRCDFNFRRFRLSNISKPQKYVESKDHFVVVLSIETVFDDNWIIKGDDLKIKTISRTIFDSITKKPFFN